MIDNTFSCVSSLMAQKFSIIRRISLIALLCLGAALSAEALTQEELEKVKFERDFKFIDVSLVKLLAGYSDAINRDKFIAKPKYPIVFSTGDTDVRWIHDGKISVQVRKGMTLVEVLDALIAFRCEWKLIDGKIVVSVIKPPST